MPRAMLVLAMVVLVLGACPSAVRAAHLDGSYCDPGIPADEERGWRAFPRGDVFCPLIADPKSDRSFATYLWSDTGSVGSVGIGDRLNLVRWNGPRVGEGVQLGLTGHVYAQFDLDVSTFDLLNADYVLGIPLSMRRGPFSGRLRLYHQSSHLGEALRSGAVIPTNNFAFEAVDAIAAVEAAGLRFYGGGEYLVDVRPVAMERWIVHGGAEVRQRVTFAEAGPLANLRFVAGLDVKAAEELAWSVQWSGRTGFEIGKTPGVEHRSQQWSLLFEYYDGELPYGSFLRDRVRLYGVGLHVGL